MSTLLGRTEAFLTRVGVGFPRAFLACFVAASALLLWALNVGPFAEWGATVFLHRWYPLAWLLTCIPAVIADPTRASGRFSAALHGALLALSLGLAYFFLGTCDLLARDDRAFWALALPLVLVLVSRLFLADLLLRYLVGRACALREVRAQVLSLYCRMLDVEPADVGAAPASTALQALSNVRLRALRILGLRLTRSLPLELALASRADAELKSLRADPSPAQFDAALAAVTDETRLQLALARSPLPACGKPTVQRWSLRWAFLWTELRRGRLRMESRSSIASKELDELMGLVGYLANSSSNEQPLLAEIAQACEGGRESRFSRLRPLWAKWEEAAERSGRSLTIVHCGIILGETLSLCSPEEFLIRRSGLDRAVVLPSVAVDLMAVIACRERLEMGGLSPTEEAPVVVNLMRSARRIGMGAPDFSSPQWARWGLANPNKWADVELGSAPLALADATPALVFINPGPGRISIGLPMVGLLVTGILAALHLRSTPYLGVHKRFVEVHAANPNIDGKAVVSVDLDYDEGRVHAATDGAGVVSVDIRDYSTRRTPGLSSQVIKDLVALRGGGYLAVTEGRDGSLGLDHIGVDGKVASVHVGLPEADVGQVLASARTLDHALETGDDVLLILGEELVLYRTQNRVLTRVNLDPAVLRDAKILDATASRRVPGKAWLLLSQRGERCIVQVSLANPASPAVETLDIMAWGASPDRICHDGVRLWCLDARGNLRERTALSWILRSGSPKHATTFGGVRTATRLEVSDLGPDIPSVLWMLKGDALFVRAIPVEEPSSRLPLPWKQVDDFKLNSDFLGKIHAYAEGRSAILLIPYRGEVKKVAFSPASGEPGKLGTWIRPREGYAILSTDGSPDGLTVSLDVTNAGFAFSQVRFLPASDFSRSTLDIHDFGSLVQGSLAQSNDFQFDSIVGVAQHTGHTHHLDASGRILTFSSKATSLGLGNNSTPPTFEIINGLSRSGQAIAPFPSGHSIGPDFKVISALQSGLDGGTLMLATSSGLAELELKEDGELIPLNALIKQHDDGPDGKLSPAAVTLAGGMPEIFFHGIQGQASERVLAQPWQVRGGNLSPAMDWQLHRAGYDGASAGDKVELFADSLRRLSISSASYQPLGPLVAIASDHELVWRTQGKNLWMKRRDQADVRWHDIAHSIDGLTLARGRSSVEESSAINNVSVLALTEKGELTFHPLWELGTKPSQSPHVSLSVFRPDAELLMPGPSQFFSYDLKSRTWSRRSLGDQPTGPVEKLRLMADYTQEGHAKRAWWWSSNGSFWGLGIGGDIAAGSVDGDLVSAEWNDDYALFLTDKNAVHRATIGGAPSMLMGSEESRGPVVEVRQLVLGESRVAALASDGSAYRLDDDGELFVKSSRAGISDLIAVADSVVGLTLDGDLMLPFTDGFTQRSKIESIRSLGLLGAGRAKDGNILIFNGALTSFSSIGTTSREGLHSIGTSINSVLEHGDGVFVAGSQGILYRPSSTGSETPKALAPVAASSEGADWLASIRGEPFAFRFEDSRFCLYHITSLADGSLGLVRNILLIGSPDSSVDYRPSGFGMISQHSGGALEYGGPSTIRGQSQMASLGSGVLHLSLNADGSRSPYLYNPGRGTDSLLAVSATLPSQKLLGAGAVIVPSGAQANDTLLVLDGVRLYQATTIQGRFGASFELIDQAVIDVMSSPGSRKGVRLRSSGEGSTILATNSGDTVLPILYDPHPLVSKPQGILPLPGLGGRFIALTEGHVVQSDVAGRRSTVQLNGSFTDIACVGPRPFAVQSMSDGLLSLTWIDTKEKIAAISQLAVSTDSLVYQSKNGAYSYVLRGESGDGSSSHAALSLAVPVELSADAGRSVQLGDYLYFIEGGQLFAYDGVCGAWSTYDHKLGPDCQFRTKDGECYIVSLSNGNAAEVNGSPLGSIQTGLALRPNQDGVEIRLSSTGASFGVVAGARVIPSSFDDFARVSMETKDFASDWHSFGDGSVLIPSLSDKRKVHIVTRRQDSFVARTIFLSFDRDGCVVHQVGKDGLLIAPLFPSLQQAEVDVGIIIRSDGSVSSEVPVEMGNRPYPLSLMSSALIDWVRLPGCFVHRPSGRKSFEVPADSASLEFRAGSWYTDVVGVEEGEPFKLATRKLRIDFKEPARISIIDPSFKPATDFHAPLGRGASIDVTIAGRLFKNWHPTRAIASGAIAAIDDIKAMGADAQGNIFLIDRDGGVWLRKSDNLSRRSYIGEVKPGSRFYLLGSNAKDIAPKLVIQSGSDVLDVTAPGLPRIVARRDFLWESISQVSRDIGGISCDMKQGKGFEFTNAHGLELGLSSRGWHLAGSAASYDLAMHAVHGPVVRLRGATFAGRAGDAYLRIDQPVSLAAIQPLGPSDERERPKPLAFKTGSMTFTPGPSGWSIRSDNGHLHRFRANGGLAVDYFDRVSSVSLGGQTHLVHSPGELGEIYHRIWTPAGLSDPVLLTNPYGLSNPREIFTYKGELYVLFGPKATQWARLALSGGMPVLEAIESKLPEWALGPQPDASRKWALRAGGLLERSDGSGGWYPMPYATDGGFRLACDDPSWSADSIRPIGTDGVVFRSAQSLDGKELWYQWRRSSPEPILWKAPLPQPHVPKTELHLGQASFARSNPTRYSLGVEGESHEFKLEVGEGIRLPHSRPAAGASFIVQQEGLLLPTAKTSDGRQLHAFFDASCTSPRYTLVAPGPVPPRTKPIRERAAVINNDGMLLCWDPSGALHLEARDGLRFKLGQAEQGKPLAYDAAATVRPLRVTEEMVEFGTDEGGDVALRLPRREFSDLRTARLIRLGKGHAGQDIFLRRSVASAMSEPELRALDSEGAPIPADKHPSVAVPKGGICLLNIPQGGHAIPLSVPSGKESWSLPMDDVVAAHKSHAGDYLVQSMEGRWLALYGRSGELKLGRLLDSNLESCRLHTQPGTWWPHLRKGETSMRLGDSLETHGWEKSPEVAYKVTEGVSLVLNGHNSYTLNLNGMDLVYRGEGPYPGTRISEAYAMSANSFDLRDNHGSRLSVDRVYQQPQAAAGTISRVFGKLTADGAGSVACARWAVSYDGKRYDVISALRPVLDADGVPYVDRVMGIGVTDGELAVDLSTHVVRLGPDGVRAFFVREEPVRISHSTRYLRHGNTKELALAVRGFASPLIGASDGLGVGAISEYLVPCADIPLRRISFFRPMDGGEIRLIQRQSYNQQDRLHIYPSGSVFKGAQLAVDRVNGVVSQDGRIFLRHEPDAEGHVPQIPSAWPGIRPRGGPQQSVDTLRDLAHPWSEPRQWRIELGTLHWSEQGYRWGD